MGPTESIWMFWNDCWNLLFPFNYWLNPFKCSETIGYYEGRWYMMLVGWTTDYRGWPTDYRRWPRYKTKEDDLDIMEDDQKN